LDGNKTTYKGDEMAILITTDGSITERLPKNGKDFKLEELRELVGCKMIERIPLFDNRFLCVDEEGLWSGKSENIDATGILYLQGDKPKGTPIIGNALLCKEGEML